MDDLKIWGGILIPLLGTGLGAATVFVMKKDLKATTQRALLGFAGGVMMAASFWSLLLPAIELSADKGKWAFLPAVGGFSFGIIFLLLLDSTIPHLHLHASEAEGITAKWSKTTLLLLAVTLHNIPEGMAVGVVYAGYLNASSAIGTSAALALALGIAIQNFPEGAIISLPLHAEGMSKGKAFNYGVLSGVVEPLGAILTILAAGLAVPLMPYLLGFAAGAMVYVVVEEMIPEMSRGAHSNLGTITFACGFVVMMILDVALG